MPSRHPPQACETTKYSDGVNKLSADSLQLSGTFQTYESSPKFEIQILQGMTIFVPTHR